MEEESFQSFMGQANVANLFSQMTGMSVQVNRKPYHIRTSDLVIQVQYIGPYFDDNSKELPQGGRLAYWRIQPIELRASFRIGDTHILTHSY
jgi:septum formation inhibitor MinC